MLEENQKKLIEFSDLDLMDKSSFLIIWFHIYFDSPPLITFIEEPFPPPFLL